MNPIEIKTNLHQLIDKIQDVNILMAVRVILSGQIHEKDADFWDVLSEEQKTSIEKGIEQANRGELKSHGEVMQRYKKWL